MFHMFVILCLLFIVGVLGKDWYRKPQYPTAYWVFDQIQFWAMWMIIGCIFIAVFGSPRA